MAPHRGRSAVMVARLVTAEAMARPRREKGREDDRAISVDLRGHQLSEEWVTLAAQRPVPGSEVSEDRYQVEWEGRRPELGPREAIKSELAEEEHQQQAWAEVAAPKAHSARIRPSVFVAIGRDVFGLWSSVDILPQKGIDNTFPAVSGCFIY
jgi:hypothetical protein